MIERQPWRRTSLVAVALSAVLAFTISSGRFGPRQHRMGDQLVSTSWPLDQILALLGISVGIVVAAVLALLAQRRGSALLAVVALAVGMGTALAALGPVTGVIATALFGYVLRPTLRA